MSDSRLFQPLKVGNLELKNRIAMAPLTRFRANDDHVHQSDLAAKYYSQRGSVPGTLLITEATFISVEAGGAPNVPGIYTQAQIDAWKTVTDAVHAKGSYIYLQLWSLGRVADQGVAEKEGFTIKGASPIPLDENSATPKEMTIPDIKSSVANYVQAAKNAIAAGFDGVEIHAANGYLIDQFLQDNTNQRTDEYGGSVENRSRFAWEITQQIAEAIGAERTGIRLSPFSLFQGMKMKDPIPQFSDIIKKLATLNLSYLHLVESRIIGNADVEAKEDLDPFISLWNGPLLIAGGFKPENARSLVDKEYPEKDIVVVFGRYFISTPDLVFRLRNNINFTEYNRDTFYVPKAEKGYTDYAFSEEFKKTASL
jgi:NADPH2 dehydrogenase